MSSQSSEDQFHVCARCLFNDEDLEDAKIHGSVNNAHEHIKEEHDGVPTRLYDPEEVPV